MADNGLNQQLEQNKQEQIKIQEQTSQFDEMVKQQRSVFDLEEHKEQATNEDSLEATKKEMQTIAEALADKNLNLNDETTAALLTRRNRDMSHAFINSKKFGGDSKEMKDIKEKLLAVEAILGENFDQKLEFKGNVHNIRKVYLAAIDSCNSYLSTKTTYTRSDRYAMVRERLMNLMDELATINDIEAKVIESKQEDDARLVNGYALLTAGRLMMWKVERENTDKKKNQNYFSGFFNAFKNMGKEQPKAPDKKKAPMKDKIETLNYQTETDDTTVQIVRLLTTEAKPQNYSKKATDDATDITHYIFNLVKNFPEGAHSEMIHTGFAGYKGKGNKRVHKDDDGKKVMNSTMLQITQNAEGKLSVTIMKDGKQQVVNLPYGRETILMNMQLDMSDKAEIFGDEALKATLDMIEKAQVDEYGTEIRNICLKLLARYSGHKANDFDNIPTRLVRSIASAFFRGKMTEEDVTLKIEEYEQIFNTEVQESDDSLEMGFNVEENRTKTEKMINNTESMELLKMRDKYKDSIDSKVVINERRVEVKNDNLPQWDMNEQLVVDFVSEFLYSKDTVSTDKSVSDPAERLADLVINNTRAIGIILANPTFLTEMINKVLPIGKLEEIEKKIIKARSEICKQANPSMKPDNLTPVQITVMLNTALLFKKEEIKEIIKVKIAEIDNEINTELEGQSKAIQEEIGKKVDSFLKPEDAVNKNERIKNAYEKGITDEEKQKRIEQGNAALNRMLKDSITGNSGQGLFIKNVFKSYFSGMSTLDKRSMISWALRESRPVSIPEKSKEELNKLNSDEKEKYEKAREAAILKSSGLLLSGLVKGAGPLFQKMMQGVPTEVLPKELKDAIEDVKSRLLPIPQEIVEAQLLAMVERSKGEVTRIEVTKSLGAASVGQAFLCKMYGPAYKDGKEVVVKLLRPDVRNRMMREKEVMLKAAEKTNDGMKTTYLGMLEQIEKELDLSIEASNVEKGDIYTRVGEQDGVVAMKLENVITPTTNSIVIEKAEGETVDSYLKRIDEESLKTLEPFLVYEERDGIKSVVYEDGFPKLNITDANAHLATNARMAISKMIANATVRQNYLIPLAKNWVDEGLFGSGFYHGDLHAGNIMISDKKATIIDFGNATQMEESQKQPVTTMITAAVVGDWKLFRSCFHALLPKDKETEERYQKNRERFGRELKYILNIGEKKMAGQRIGVALVKAQELGLELPSIIFNFSQCQLRIQNTINEMNRKIEMLRKTKDLLREPKFMGGDYYVPELFASAAMSYLPSSRKKNFVIRMANNLKLKVLLDCVQKHKVPEGAEEIIKIAFDKAAKSTDIRDLIKEQAKDLLDPKSADSREKKVPSLANACENTLQNMGITMSKEEKDELTNIFKNPEGYEEKVDKLFNKYHEGWEFGFDSCYKKMTEAVDAYLENVEENNSLTVKIVDVAFDGKEKAEELLKRKAIVEEKGKELQAQKDKYVEMFNALIHLHYQEEIEMKDERDERKDYDFYGDSADVDYTDLQSVFGRWQNVLLTKTANAPIAGGIDYLGKFKQQMNHYIEDEKYGLKFEKALEKLEQKIIEMRNDIKEKKENTKNFTRAVDPYVNEVIMYGEMIAANKVELLSKDKDELRMEEADLSVKLDDFVDAMSTTLDNHLSETAQRVGYFWAWWHRNELKISDNQED